MRTQKITNNIPLSLGRSKIVKTLKAIVGQQKPVNRSKPTRLPPFFLQTCSEVGEERDEFSPKEINLPKEARLIFFFFMLLNYIYTIYICTDL